jgi:hypothetical protein
MVLHDSGEHTRGNCERLTWRLALYIRALGRQRVRCVVNCESGSAHQPFTEEVSSWPSWVTSTARWRVLQAFLIACVISKFVGQPCARSFQPRPYKYRSAVRPLACKAFSLPRLPAYIQGLLQLKFLRLRVASSSPDPQTVFHATTKGHLQ